MSKKYKIGDHLEVKIEKIVPNGFGLAFAENLTVFVPLSVAGDKLRVQIYQIKGRSAFAEILTIIKPADDRIEPKCTYFGKCGGCNFQQMAYDVQVEAKIGIIRDCLTRIGKIDFHGEISVVPSPRPFEYRARAQWHLETRLKQIGYFQRNSHQIIDVESCPILTEQLQATLSDLRKNIEWSGFWSETVRIEAANAGDQVSVFSDEVIEPTREIEFNLNGRRYFYNANTFFQGNPFLIEKLIEAAISGAKGENALDLYCGAGLFSLPLAEKFDKVIGVESSGRASDFGEKNAVTAGIENIEFYTENVAEFLAENAGNLKNTDFLLLDPPRAGTDKSVIEGIIKLNPRQISYISCEPSILARDLSILTASGFTVESITALDLFPQTHHIETIVRLTR